MAVLHFFEILHAENSKRSERLIFVLSSFCDLLVKDASSHFPFPNCAIYSLNEST